MKKIALTVLLFVFSTAGYGASDATVVAEVGNWTVKIVKDSFSGETTCRGDYKHNTRTYLMKDELYLVTTKPFAMDTVTIRYGEDPPTKTRKPSVAETRFGTIIINGKEFAELLKHNRVRTRATLPRSTTEEDVDLTGILDAVKIIRNDCKV